MFSSFEAIVNCVATLFCAERIEKFLKAGSRLDHRLLARPIESAQPSYAMIPQVTGGNSSDIELVQVLPAAGGKSRFSQTSEANAIVVQNGTFGWDVDNEPVLRDINFAIKKSQMVMIVGPVGCGKTTLCKSLLGEVPSSKGFVHISQLDISFCDQTPWLIVGSPLKQLDVVYMADMSLELLGAEKYYWIFPSRPREV